MRSGDFERVADRRGTASVKWDRYGGRDVLPLWVADMDFAAPPAVLDALSRRVAHGIFGYTHASAALTEAVLAHVARRHGWKIEAEWLVWLPGAVAAIHAACRLVEAGAPVVSCPPIYPPFLAAPANMGRRRLEVPLAADEDGRAVLDLDGLARAFAQGPGLFLFCNPHNPTGRVFDATELAALAERLLAQDMLVVSDELHADLVLEPGLRHRPLAAVSPALAERTITLFAPSKTFNLAGLGIGYAVIPGTELRRRFRAAIDGILPYVNALAYAAAEAAYTECGDWLAALLAYLRDNRDHVTGVLAGIAGIAARPPEGTYLYWLDLRGTGIDNPVAHLERHGVGLSDGADFGAPGFARLNFGCPRATLEAACSRLTDAFVP
ncbi:MAG TPA: PatB family C-S lyase [Gammaproteobacteria bacterium]|nr:PatB family C-S lyase [Gammaproteobacteria bacterium]